MKSMSKKISMTLAIGFCVSFSTVCVEAQQIQSAQNEFLGFQTMDTNHYSNIRGSYCKIYTPAFAYFTYPTGANSVWTMDYTSSTDWIQLGWASAAYYYAAPNNTSVPAPGSSQYFVAYTTNGAYFEVDTPGPSEGTYHGYQITNELSGSTDQWVARVDGQVIGGPGGPILTATNAMEVDYSAEIGLDTDHWAGKAGYTSQIINPEYYNGNSGTWLTPGVSKWETDQGGSDQQYATLDLSQWSANKYIMIYDSRN